jgi:hypothetical protein
MVAGAVALSGLAPAPDAAAQSGTTKPMDGSTYRVQLQDVRTHVDEVHDGTRRILDRLRAMDARISPSDYAPARVELVVENEMSAALTLVGVTVLLDKEVVYERTDATGELAAMRTVPVYTGAMTPGDHALVTVLHYEGSGAVLPYMRGYKFELRESRVFTATGGRTTTVAARAYERGDVTTPFVQRPSLAWVERSRPTEHAH